MIARSPFQDYCAPAFYMVTITAYERRPHFAICENNRSTLTPDGWLVYNHWQRIAQDYPQIAVSTLCIMPDHLHGILHVTERMEKPVGHYFDLCVQGRLLILSSNSLRLHVNKESNALTRDTCLAMNTACSQIARAAFNAPAEGGN